VTNIGALREGLLAHAAARALDFFLGEFGRPESDLAEAVGGDHRKI
jgi:hypothetical protein